MSSKKAIGKMMNHLLDETAKLENARAAVASMATDDLDVSDWELFEDNSVLAYFEKLRRDDPVHYHEDSKVGPFWSITKFDDIKAVDTNIELFSNEPTVILSGVEDFNIPSFLNRDPPVHDEQRKAVAQIVSPTNLGRLESTIRERACSILDKLPIGEEFDWVETVSVELTSQMLATLLNLPLDDRRRLIRWSDVFTLGSDQGEVVSKEERMREIADCYQYFSDLRDQRAKQEPHHDLVSMLAHGAATKDLTGDAFLANIMLLIVGGNDTTRNTISGSVLSMNMFPDQYAKLKANPSLVKNMVPEVIRWQTPLAHMQRRAKHDLEFGGKRIAKDDRVVMWYLSGNRDEEIFVTANDLDIERPNARQHVSFGYGIHRCLGNRLAEMQLRVLWEEILKRFKDIEVVGPATRTRSNFIHGYLDLPVIVRA